MGTRNLTCVHHNGELRVAKYCQWDGYPGGQGAGLLEFLKGGFDREAFIDGLNRCEPIDKDKLMEYWESVGVTDGGATLEQSRKFEEKYPSLHRDTGSDIIQMIQESEGSLPIRNEPNFARDSLFCEWAYVLDLDRDVLEVYEGFQKEPIDEPERFWCPDDQRPNEDYWPVKKVVEFPLDNLPSVKGFIERCQEDPKNS